MTLTPRELDCLRAAARGLTVRQTAHHLGVSVHTVRNQRASLMARLDAPTIAAAVAIGVGEGWIDWRSDRAVRPMAQRTITLAVAAGPR